MYPQEHLKQFHFTFLFDQKYTLVVISPTLSEIIIFFPLYKSFKTTLSVIATFVQIKNKIDTDDFYFPSFKKSYFAQ